MNEKNKGGYCACSLTMLLCMNVLHAYYIVFFFYTPLHDSGGVLWFHICRPCVRLSVRLLNVRPSVFSFPDDNLSGCQWIFTKLGICIAIVDRFLTELSRNDSISCTTGIQLALSYIWPVSTRNLLRLAIFNSVLVKYDMLSHLGT